MSEFRKLSQVVYDFKCGVEVNNLHALHVQIGNGLYCFENDVPIGGDILNFYACLCVCTLWNRAQPN